MNTSPAFLYGESVFTSTRVKGGRLFFEQEHLCRLQKGIEEYYLGRPMSNLEVDDLKKRIADFLKGLGEDESRLRISVFAEGRDSLLPAVSDFSQLKIDFRLSELVDGKAVSLKSFQSPFSPAYPDMKMGSYMPLLHTRIMAARAGADDALLIDQAGNCLEASTSNIFFYKGKRVYSPSSCILNGVVKRAVEELVEVEKIDVSPGEAARFDGAFLTNSSWVVRPVQSIDGANYENLNQSFLKDMLEKTMARGYR